MSKPGTGRESRLLFAVNVAAAAFVTGLLGMTWPPVTRSVLVGVSVALWLLAVIRRV
jgi:hypothetical protein